MRPDGRAYNQTRAVTFECSPLIYPEGSVLIKMGKTHVLCAVTITPGVPRWMQGSGRGWLTAEYALLPRATQNRTPRNHIQRGRAQEIRRLIGRSLRQAVDLNLLGEYTIIVDCDVLQADGGTRTASITGGYVAVALSLHQHSHILPTVLRPPIAAISAGVVEGEPLLDLAYQEDANADVDLNVVMNAQGHFIEIQGTAERAPISRTTLNTLLDLSNSGIETLIQIQREALGCAGITL